jgi:hypothetical protein
MRHQRDRIELVVSGWLSAVTAVLGFAALAGCAETAAREGRLASPVILTLSPYTGRLRTVTVTVNGERLTLLFDTGGGQTLVSPPVADRIGRRCDGVSTGFRMSGERVTFRQCGRVELGLGEVTHELSSLAVFDLNALLPAELPRLDGLLALDALTNIPFTLELGANRLTLETASSLRARIADATPVDMRVATGVDGGSASVFLSARAPSGQNLWLELDSGNLAAVLLATHVRVDAGTSAATAGEVPLTLGRITTAPLAYERRELILDGALNAEFLERYAVTIDMVQRRAWITVRR